MATETVNAPKEILNVREAAAALGVSTSTINRWIASGTVPSHKIGGARRLRWSELMRLFEGDAA